MTKIPKTAQVAFNQFMFDTMMAKIREVELLEKKVLAHEDLLKVHVQTIGELGRRSDHFTDEVKNLISQTEGLTNAIISHREEIKELHDVKKSGCSSCKYEENHAYNPPCSGCINGNGEDENWKAKGRFKKS